MTLLYNRKHHVNDVVFAYCNACRTGQWVYPIWDSGRALEVAMEEEKVFALNEWMAKAMRVFLRYASESVASSNVTTVQLVTIIDRLALFLRGMTQEEVVYAIRLMDKYYPSRT